MEPNSVFICSSSKALDVALSIQQKLCDEYEVEIWNEQAFVLTDHYLESIEQAIQRCQFAIIVVTPDTELAPNEQAPGDAIFSARDNIVFEMGYFLGVLKRKRTFFVVEKKTGFKLPSYIDGINRAEFVRPPNANLLDTALNNAVSAIKRAISKVPGIVDEWVEDMVTTALNTACRALAVPFYPEEAKIRAFVFKKQTEKLCCTHFWAPFSISEVIGLNFEINAETEKQVAVVMAAQKKKVCAVSVSVLPESMDGVNGNVDKDLCYILAAPISGPRGEIWGTIDFDASNERGENLLRTEVAKQVIFQLGKHLYGILEGT